MSLTSSPSLYATQRNLIVLTMNGAYKRESYGAKHWLAASLAGGRYFWAGYAPWKDNHCTKTIVSLGDHLRTNQSCQGMRPETTIHSEQCRLFVHDHAGRAAGCGEGKFAVCLDLIFIQASIQTTMRYAVPLFVE